VFKVISLSLILAIFSGAIVLAQETAFPEEEDPLSLSSPMERGEAQATGDSRWACMWNNSRNQTLYMSWRFDKAGTSNFSIEPGGSHRLFVGTNDGWVCWAYGSPIGSSCPNASRIRSGWAGNCP